MLNYGAYSQIYFGEDNTNLANAILKADNTATIKSEDIIKSITYSEQGLFSNKDLEYMGSSLICESDTSLKLYFNNKNKLTEKQIRVDMISAHLTKTSMIMISVLTEAFSG